MFLLGIKWSFLSLYWDCFRASVFIGRKEWKCLCFLCVCVCLCPLQTALLCPLKVMKTAKRELKSDHCKSKTTPGYRKDE